MLVSKGKRSMLTLFSFQIKLHLLSWFTTGEKHRLLFLWRLIRETSWSFWTDWQEQKEAWEGRGRGEIMWLECITHRQWLMAGAILLLVAVRFNTHLTFAVSGRSLGSLPLIWRVEDFEILRIKMLHWWLFFFFFFCNHYLALRASLCPWILLFQPGNLLCWQPQLPSPSPCWCWEKPEVVFSPETLWQNFPSPSLLITGEVRCRPAPLTSCSVVFFPSHSHLGPHPLLLWVLLGSWTQWAVWGDWELYSSLPCSLLWVLVSLIL